MHHGDFKKHITHLGAVWRQVELESLSSLGALHPHRAPLGVRRAEPWWAGLRLPELTLEQAPWPPLASVSLSVDGV